MEETALPAMMQGMTRSGSPTANGMAPSVMLEAPRIQAAFPASRSSSVYLFLKMMVERASASGGVTPPAMTAANGT